jgi:hypothetical protein
MRYALACLITLAAAAGCASTDVTRMSATELCYTRMVDEDNKPKAEMEISRRKVDCNQHADAVRKMHEQEQRAGMTGGGYTEGTRVEGQGGLLKGK